MPEPSDDVNDPDVEREEAPSAAEHADHAARRVYLRPEAGETKEEFSARFLTAVMDQRRGREDGG